MEQVIRKIGLRNVQNSLCLMFLKYNKPQLAKRALATSDQHMIEKMVSYIDLRLFLEQKALASLPGKEGGGA